jgi:hypothetical protein
MSAARHTEQHPNEQMGIDADSPKPDLQSAPDPTSAATWKKMACYNLVTGDFVGYLGTYNNNLDLLQDADDAANLVWYSSGSDLYLRKATTPNDRYLGLGWNGYACWGLWTPTGWVNPVVYNSDHTISLKEDPKRKLYGPYGNDWVCWTGGEDNQNILRCEMTDR